MPSLNARQEAFARHIVKGAAPSQAYRKAGYSKHPATSWVGSSNLIRNPKVANRVAELQSKMTSATLVTAETIIAELDEARQGALASGQHSAAVAASLGKAKIRGLIVDRREVGAPGEFASMDADALRNWIAQQIEGAMIDVTPNADCVPVDGTKPETE